MPNYLGILTKQELSSMEAAFTSATVENHIRRIVDLIKQPQMFFPLTQRTLTLNETLPRAVADYFKNEMQYNVSENQQPNNMTFLISISW